MTDQPTSANVFVFPADKHVSDGGCPIQTDAGSGSAKKYPFGHDAADMDLLAFLALRDWLESALVDKGAKFVGGGVGCGIAHIHIKLDGMDYGVNICPIPLCDGLA